MNWPLVSPITLRDDAPRLLLRRTDLGAPLDAKPAQQLRYVLALYPGGIEHRLWGVHLGDLRLSCSNIRLVV